MLRIPLRPAPIAVLVALLVILPLAGRAVAEILPEDHPRTLTERADLVVEGQVGDGGVVRVERTYVPSPDWTTEQMTLPIPVLATLDRRLHADWEPGEEIASRRAILFLRYDHDARAFAPLDTIGAGSQGVWWIDGGRALHYTQWINPGPYVLTGWRPQVPDGPVATADELRAAVENGVRGRRLILAATTARDSARAVALWIDYLRKPDANTYLAARELRHCDTAAHRLGDALADGQDATTTGQILEVLGWMKEDGRPAARRVAVLLDRPDLVPRRRVLAALVAMAAPTSRDACRKVLAEGSLEDASFAAEVLEKIDDPERAARIRRRVEDAAVTRENTPWLWRLLGILHRADVGAARPFARQWQDDERFPQRYRETFRDMLR